MKKLYKLLDYYVISFWKENPAIFFILLGVLGVCCFVIILIAGHSSGCKPV